MSNIYTFPNIFNSNSFIFLNCYTANIEIVKYSPEQFCFKPPIKLIAN